MGADHRRGAATAQGIRSCWILTDGKAGDEAQCRGVAEAMGISCETRRVGPGWPFVWLMPWGPIDPREGPDWAKSPIAPPYPDLLIASGRRAVPYVRRIKQASEGRTFTVFLKDPRTGSSGADFIWVPEHDSRRGRHVLSTVTSPHRISPERLAAARESVPPEIEALTYPRVALILGGKSRAFTYNARTNRRLAEAIRVILNFQPHASFMVTPSRRTPQRTVQAVREVLGDRTAIIWDGEGENPYLDFLAHADFIIAPADSVNMVGEAVATGTPVYVFRPEGRGGKIERFLASLSRAGAVRELDGPLVPFSYEPIDATPRIAAEILRRFADRQEHVAKPG
ncbi:MAG TPA: mitochondrial fission ELM1 family protein [Hyphomicrobiales bacterium]|nr:mitochondrial fission ELM1 family protein [Hyphomicrobiales bacterium]